MAKRTAAEEGPSWSSTSFLVEALILLVVLIASMAVFTTLFVHAASGANDAARLSSATAIAQNAAEEFSSNPQAVAAGKKVGEGMAKSGGDSDFDVTCKVSSENEGAGVLYTAAITVSDDAGEVYSLTASRYVSGVE